MIGSQLIFMGKNTGLSINVFTTALFQRMAVVIWCLCTALQQHAGKVGVVEFKMSFVVELEKCGGIRMVLF